jgi:ribokinase
VDHVYSLDHIVAAGETETTKTLNLFPGGKGLNQSIALARAGAAVYHAGCIGEGGEFLFELLQANGVDVTFVDRVKEKNGLAIIQVSKDGENAIFLYPGSNEMISTEQVDRVIACFSEGDILLLQNEINNPEYIISKAYQAGMKIILNPSPFNERIRQIDFNMLSYLILNEIEAKEISSRATVREALEYFKESYPRLKIMLTLGSKGCVYQDGEVQKSFPIFKVDAGDTTGAGDTFTGYFVAGITNGYEVEEILRFASCASAISVTREGAAVSIPRIDEVMEWVTRLETNDITYE